MTDYVRWLSELGMDDVPVVGGKNASLGEMIQHLTQLGVQVPGGFATTAQAYRDFLAVDGLAERIAAELDALDVDDIAALSAAGPRIRGWIIEQPFQPELDQAVERPMPSSPTRPAAPPTPPGRYAPRPPPRICPMPPSPVSRRPSSTSTDSTTSSSRSRRSSPRSTTIAPSPIGYTRASPMPRSRSRPASSAWCAAISPPAA